MRRRCFCITLLVLLLATACGGQVSPAVEPNILAAPAEVQEDNTPVDEAAPPAETAAPNCLGDEISPIGQSIADDYESVSYEEIMTWFCNGAEFENILVALETEAQTDSSADEMLQLLAEGFTWEEIWQLVGLTD